MPKKTETKNRWQKMVSSRNHYNSSETTGDAARNKFNKSIYLQTMQKTHTSIIPEEYEPYSTGKWSSLNPHAMAI